MKRFWILVSLLVCIVAIGVWWYSTSGISPMLDAVGNIVATTTPATTTATTNTVATNHPKTSQQDVVSIAESLSGTSRFAGLLSSTGVGASLRGRGPYTIFVPTDGAFSLLPSKTIANLTSAQIKRLVQYHVIVGREVDPNALKSGSVIALSKDPLNFSVGSDQTPRVDSAIIIEEHKGTNGIVYLINGVLLPPKKGSI